MSTFQKHTTHIYLFHTYQEFLDAGYAINFNGTVYDGSTAYTVTADPSVYVSSSVIAVTAADVTAKKYPGITAAGNYYVATNEQKYYPEAQITKTAVTLNYARLCADAFKADINNPPSNVSEVITNLINSGDVTLVEKKKADNIFLQQSAIDFDSYETSVATNTGLREVQDETLLRKAEAKYEADMKKIDMKDRKFDQDLAALEAERNAIKQEMETLKTVAKENVERTFKLFS